MNYSFIGTGETIPASFMVTLRRIRPYNPDNPTTIEFVPQYTNGRPSGSGLHVSIATFSKIYQALFTLPSFRRQSKKTQPPSHTFHIVSQLSFWNCLKLAFDRKLVLLLYSVLKLTFLHPNPIRSQDTARCTTRKTNQQATRMLMMMLSLPTTTMNNNQILGSWLEKK